MKRLLAALLVVGLLAGLAPGPIEAVTGTVVYTHSRCDYFVTESWMGFALLEWYDGPKPIEGDILVGDFESPGRIVIYNFTQDSDFTVWVEDYWLTRQKVTEEFWQRCPK
jgi:hypothetical protein